MPTKALEYKVVRLNMRGFGVHAMRVPPDLEEQLNVAGSAGWHLVDSIATFGLLGITSNVTLILEREKSGQGG